MSKKTSLIATLLTTGAGFALGFLSNRLTNDQIEEMVADALEDSQVGQFIEEQNEAIRLYQLHATLVLEVLERHLENTETKLDADDEAVIESIRLHYQSATIH